MDLDSQKLQEEVKKIHKSTQTLINIFIPLHHFLRQKSKLYYKWHLFEFFYYLNWTILVLSIVFIFGFSFHSLKINALSINDKTSSLQENPEDKSHFPLSSSPVLEEKIFSEKTSPQETSPEKETSSPSSIQETSPEKETSSPSSITIISPNGGEILAGSSIYNIKWETKGDNFNYIKLFYSLNDLNYLKIASLENKGIFRWMIPLGINSKVVKIRAEAYDNRNILISSDTSNPFTIDSEPPTFEITTLTDGQYLNLKTWRIAGVASDNLSGIEKVEISTDGGFNWHQTKGVKKDIITYWSFDWKIVQDGQYKIKNKVFDKAGNIKIIPGITVTVDTIPPQVSLNPLPSNPSNNHTPTFTGEAVDEKTNIVKVEYTLDDGNTWHNAPALDSSFDSPIEGYKFTTPRLVDGPYTVKTRAYDQAGNVTPVSNYASYTFTIDITPPDRPVITSPPDKSTTLEAIIEVMGGAEAFSVVEVFVNDFSSGTTIVDENGNFKKQISLILGDNVIRVQATDQAGNKSKFSFNVKVTRLK